MKYINSMTTALFVITNKYVQFVSQLSTNTQVLYTHLTSDIIKQMLIESNDTMHKT